jgi:hypothetical protein
MLYLRIDAIVTTLVLEEDEAFPPESCQSVRVPLKMGWSAFGVMFDMHGRFR